MMKIQDRSCILLQMDENIRPTPKDEDSNRCLTITACLMEAACCICMSVPLSSKTVYN
jgi:hypothetical protein